MGNLAIENVVNISVSQPGAGIGKYNTSNLALFTADPFNAVSFGALGYKLYLEPTEVGVDFGTNSDTFKMANAIFSQQPNILTPGGYLVIMPLIKEVQKITFPLVSASGAFKLVYDGVPTIDINWDDTAAIIQVQLRLIAGLEDVIVTGAIATELVINFDGVEGDVNPLTLIDNTLLDAVAAPVVPVVSEDITGEEIGTAVTRTASLVQYFGAMATYIEAQAELLATAAIVQALNKIYFCVSMLEADVLPGGKFDLVRSGGFTKTRTLLYIHNSIKSESFVMMASYTGRGLSTDFSGSNTTQTMHLKDLIGVQADSAMTQTILDLCKDSGTDIYVSIEDVAKVFTSGANDFFDDVYNLQWLIGDLSVAAFNILATVSTKVPQTEDGISKLKGGHRKVCEKGITNGFLARGEWNNPITFGIQQDLYDNIAQRGYYLYSQPVAQQSAVDRETRISPLIQLAVKYAGANHSTSLVININK